MNDLLGTVSSQFNRSIVVGSLLPVIIGLTFAQALAVPLPTLTQRLLSPLLPATPQNPLLTIALGVVALALLLYALNTTLIRWFEGYYWRDSWVGRWRVRHFQRRRATAQTYWTTLRIVADAIRADASLATPEQLLANLQGARRAAGILINFSYPESDDLVLPTRLGNTIRAFERYPRRQYGMNLVLLWPHLLAVIDKDVVAGIETEKSLFDCLLNTAFLSGIVALLAATGGHARGGWPGVLLLGLVGIGSYHAAVGRAAAWGEQVKAACDLYRRDLLARLGFVRPHQTLQEERDTWVRINRQLVYGDSTKTPLPPLAFARTRVLAQPEGTDSLLTRGQALPARDGGVTITIAVANTSTVPLSRLVVVEELPPTAAYEWGSASGGVTVTGTNPYWFTLDQPLAAGASFTFTYRQVRGLIGGEADGNPPHPEAH